MRVQIVTSLTISTRTRPITSGRISPLFLFAVRPLRRFTFSLTCAALAAFPVTLHAQEQHVAAVDFPDAPSAVLARQQSADNAAQTPVNPANGGQPKQTKRILGIVPNFRAVSAGTKLPPQTVKEKFVTTTQQSFDYSSFVFSAALAGVDLAQDSTPQFGHGGVGYGRYLWHTFADQTDENFMVQAIFPSVTHEDSRYYTLGHGGIPKRALYAFDRTLITRSDYGGETFNFSEVVGAGAASGVSTLYYPSADKTWTKTGQRWLTNVIIDGVTYTFQEFWPDINNALFHQRN